MIGGLTVARPTPHLPSFLPSFRILRGVNHRISGPARTPRPSPLLLNRLDGLGSVLDPLSGSRKQPSLKLCFQVH